MPFNKLDTESRLDIRSQADFFAQVALFDIETIGNDSDKARNLFAMIFDNKYEWSQIHRRLTNMLRNGNKEDRCKLLVTLMGNVKWVYERIEMEENIRVWMPSRYTIFQKWIIFEVDLELKRQSQTSNFITEENVKKSNGLTKPMIALICIYNNRTITADNATTIAKEFGHDKAGRLYLDYCHYCTKTNLLSSADFSIKKIKNRINLFNSVISKLEGKPKLKAQDDLNTFMSRLDPDLRM